MNAGLLQAWQGEHFPDEGEVERTPYKPYRWWDEKLEIAEEAR